MTTLGLRLPEPLEGEFRAHYRREFINFMRAVWYLAAVFWLLGAYSDHALFPDNVYRLWTVRAIVFAFTITTALAASFPRTVGDGVHAIAAVSAAGGGVGSVVMLGLVPYPSNTIFFVTVFCVLVATSTFVGVLRFTYTAASAAVTLTAFLACVFWLTATPVDAALRMTFGLVGLTTIVLVCSYVTERYARENFVQRRRLEVSEQRALEANRAKSIFLSNMSHELRTPLNAVLGFAQLMERDPTLSPDSLGHLRTIHRSGEHLLGLIDDVLAISKIEAGRITLAEQPFDLGHLLAGVAELVRVRAEAKDLRLEYHAAEDLPGQVTGDEGKLRQVLLNLLGNAVKFTNEGGVSLRASWDERDGGRARFEVEDTGPGIAPAELDALFEPFTQTETGRRSQEGTGLGLAITRTFVRLMGGDVAVRSEVGVGTLFSFDVPLRVSSEPVAPQREAARVVGLVPGQPHWRLLVVDDSLDNRTLLSGLLRSVGFEVREATNGREAVDEWQAWRPHFIWMDMRMPVMDGYEATKVIRRKEGVRSQESGVSSEPRAVATGSTERGSAGPESWLLTPDSSSVKIVALTASAFQHDREAILENGCDDFVTKPFRETTIFEKMEQHLGVAYVVEGTATAASGGGDGALTADRVASLPVELIAELRASLVAGDVALASRAVDRIEPIDAPLAGELRRSIRAYRIDDLLDLVGDAAG
jgi:signal transduction histidine kinase/FixJ family two-component response regulator